MRHPALTLCLCAAALLLGGCDVLGIETAPQVAARKDAEGMAIGSACRHAIRSVEDCFRSNPKAGKASVFAGWKDMDQYMRDNQIVGMPTEIKPEEAESGHEDEAPKTPGAEPAKARKS
jgi:hypothetical protein